MNLVEIETFLAIAELGSLVKASRRLNVTASAVTSRVHSLEEQIDAAVEKSVSNFERFFGTLTDEQIAIVREHKTRTYDPSGGWLDWRDKRQQDLVQFLRTEPSVKEIEEYVTVALTTPEKIVGKAYRKRADGWWDAQTALNYDLMITLDAGQRKTFADNLRGYAIDMVELADAS